VGYSIRSPRNGAWRTLCHRREHPRPGLKSARLRHRNSYLLAPTLGWDRSRWVALAGTGTAPVQRGILLEQEGGCFISDPPGLALYVEHSLQMVHG
jgi:hypothetical protein